MFAGKIARRLALMLRLKWGKRTEKFLAAVGVTSKRIDDVEYEETPPTTEYSKKLAEEVDKYLGRLADAPRCFDRFDTFGVSPGTPKRRTVSSPTEEVGDSPELLELSVLDVRELAEWLPFIGEVSLRKVESEEQNTSFAEEWRRLSDLVKSIVSKGVNVAPKDVALEVIEKFGLEVLIFRMITEALLSSDKVSEIWTPKVGEDVLLRSTERLFEHGYCLADPSKGDLNSRYVDLMSSICFVPREELADDEDYSDKGIREIHKFFSKSIKDVMCRRSHWKPSSGVPNQRVVNFRRSGQIDKIRDLGGPKDDCEALALALDHLTGRRSSLSVRVKCRNSNSSEEMFLWYTSEKLKRVQEKGGIVFSQRSRMVTTIAYFYVILSLVLAVGIPAGKPEVCDGEAFECIQAGVFIASTFLVTAFGFIKLWSDDERILHNTLFGRVVFKDLDALLDHFKIREKEFVAILLRRGLGYPWLSTKNLSMIQSGGDGSLVFKRGIFYETLREYQIAGGGFLSDGRSTRKLEKVSSDLWHAEDATPHSRIILEEPLGKHDIVA